MIAVEVPEWMRAASCAGSGLDYVFVADERPPRAELVEAARVCARCPVRAECARDALERDAYGLWGGAWHTFGRPRSVPLGEAQ